MLLDGSAFLAPVAQIVGRSSRVGVSELVGRCGFTDTEHKLDVFLLKIKTMACVQLIPSLCGASPSVCEGNSLQYLTLLFVYGENTTAIRPSLLGANIYEPKKWGVPLNFAQLCGIADSAHLTVPTFMMLLSSEVSRDSH